mmetsp:Transcript_4570/g.8896  ORF Transcript_4570/g.8896 Transcript_4570/m.8896 type:complete len:402 (+) Transcript_4570:59-1264(+)
MASAWRDDFLLVTATTPGRIFIACQVSQAFLARVRQVIISDVEPFCQRSLLAWHTLPPGEGRRFPRRLVAAPRIANETAERLGWSWRWMLLADDDCVVTVTRDLWHSLQALDHNAPWYLGALDSLWQPAPLVSILQPEDNVRLPSGRLTHAGSIFPACTLPVQSTAPSSTENPGGMCLPQLPADARRGCVRGPSLAACALDLLRAPRNASATFHAPYGYDVPLTIVYGNGFVMSRGILRVGGLRDAGVGWKVNSSTETPIGRLEACEISTPDAVTYADEQLVQAKLQGGPGARAPVLAGDWHLSRCMQRISQIHYPTVLPRRLHRRTFEHVTDHGRLHSRVMSRLAIRLGIRLKRDRNGYVHAPSDVWSERLAALVHNTGHDDKWSTPVEIASRNRSVAQA